jgi:hypothetical protein
MAAELLLGEDDDPLKVRHALEHALGHRPTRHGNPGCRKGPNQII